MNTNDIYNLKQQFSTVVQILQLHTDTLTVTSGSITRYYKMFPMFAVVMPVSLFRQYTLTLTNQMGFNNTEIVEVLIPKSSYTPKVNDGFIWNSKRFEMSRIEYSSIAEHYLITALALTNLTKLPPLLLPVGHTLRIISSCTYEVINAG